MPSVKQVEGTLPSAFREKYPSTYCIIDGSEIFMETPSDLHMQSSTWSSYKHHNTAKFLMESLMHHLTEVNEKQHAAEVSSMHWKSTACMVANY